MKNIHLIPTDKPSRLCYDKDDNLLFASNAGFSIADGKQNIYITSAEDIKEGHWVFDGENTYKWTTGDVEDCLYNPGANNYKGCKKIILTTDQDLIADGVQDIDDEFLEWFVKNTTCDFVEVKDAVYFDNVEWISCYKIIIPQEEYTSQDFLNQICWNNSKQETLEEAAINHNKINWKSTIIAFEKGAKWQAEKMYSEEDMIEFAVWVYLEVGKNSGKERTNKELFKEWFERFKKK